MNDHLGGKIADKRGESVRARFWKKKVETVGGEQGRPYYHGECCQNFHAGSMLRG